MARLSLDQKFQRATRITLGERLEYALALCLPNAPVWDLCCDHGLLGVKALLTGRSQTVHFVDQLPNVMADLHERLRRTLPELYLSRVFLLTMRAEEIAHFQLSGTIFLLGVGETTTIRILEAIVPHIQWNSSRLVVIPEKRGNLVARYFDSQVFPIVQRSVTKVRKGFDRQIFIAEGHSVNQ